MLKTTFTLTLFLLSLWLIPNQAGWTQSAPEGFNPGPDIYRMSGGAGNNERFEQIGQSWVKHAFGADQADECFVCQPGSDFIRLGVGCSDTYASDQNATWAGSSCQLSFVIVTMRRDRAVPSRGRQSPKSLLAKEDHRTYNPHHAAPDVTDTELEDKNND